MRSCLRLFGAVLLAAALLTVPAVAKSPGRAEAAAPTLSASPNVVVPDRVTTVAVTGSDYLVPPHAPGTDVFGGVYVFFGWVADGNWGPSARNSNNNQGTFGVSYAYPGEGGDASTRDDGSGNVRLVSFTEGGESGNATDYHMDADGNWTTEIQVYGSTFTSTNPNTGQTRTFDCQDVRCGVFTVGAHGKASSTNERFTPITFSDDAGTGGGGGEGQGSGGAGAPAPPAGGNGDGAGDRGDDEVGAAPDDESTPASTTTVPPTTTTTTTTTTPPTTASSTITTLPATTRPTDTAPPTTVESRNGDDEEDEDEGIALEASSVDSTGGSTLPVLVTGLVVAVIVTAGFLLRRWRRRKEAVT